MTAFLVGYCALALLTIGLCAWLGAHLSKIQLERDTAQRAAELWEGKWDHLADRYHDLEKSLSEAHAAIESRAKLIEKRDETIRMHELVLEAKTKRLNDLVSQVYACQSKLFDVQAERDRYRAQVEKFEAAAQKPKTSKRGK